MLGNGEAATHLISDSHAGATLESGEVYRNWRRYCSDQFNRHLALKVVLLVQFAVYAAYRNRLETAFLADQLASAISTAGEAPKLTSPEMVIRSGRLASSAGTPQPSAPSTPVKSVLANGSAAADPPPVPVSHPHGGVSIGTPVQPAADETRSEQELLHPSNTGNLQLIVADMRPISPCCSRLDSDSA